MKNLTSIYWIKDEARYIPEFIEFHLLQGFDYFIFYDNKSTDNLDLTIPKTINRFQNLEVLMFMNCVTSIPNEIGDLKELKFISLAISLLPTMNVATKSKIATYSNKSVLIKCPVLRLPTI
jgi:hypothetical protein